MPLTSLQKAIWRTSRPMVIGMSRLALSMAVRRSSTSAVATLAWPFSTLSPCLQLAFARRDTLASQPQSLS